MLLALALPLATSAHEAYVLSPEDVAVKSGGPQFNVFTVLSTPEHARLFYGMTLLGILVLAAAFFWGRGRQARLLKTWIEAQRGLGPLFLRLGAGGALVFGALGGQFLGPEMAAFSPLLAYIAGAAGLLLILGVVTSFAASLGLILYLLSFEANGAYAFSYFCYIGVFGALFFSGGGKFSLYRKLDLPGTGLASMSAFVRVSYGLMLLYGALAIKFLTPALTLGVVTNFNMAGGIFPSEPLLVVLGAALTELALALMIIFGFELRLALFASLTFATTALLFLPEPFWPHLILYGVSLYLLVTPQTYSIDGWTERRLKAPKV